MCRRVECSECRKPTYAGCGKHVEQVPASVPGEERCSYREHPKKKANMAEGARPSIFRRLFGE